MGPGWVLGALPRLSEPQKEYKHEICESQRALDCHGDDYRLHSAPYGEGEVREGTSLRPLCIPLPVAVGPYDAAAATAAPEHASFQYCSQPRLASDVDERLRQARLGHGYGTRV
ncbi:unnamed protein product [Symbiodinium microadriaticum]|nr:unnamed protein product [Symbiodinium sp. KB8]CAE7199557.1 unnamed protein product [Symbiodinium microadriaticum]